MLFFFYSNYSILNCLSLNKAPERKAKREAYLLLRDIHLNVSYDYLHIVSKRLHWSTILTIQADLRKVIDNIGDYVKEDFFVIPLRDDMNSLEFTHDEYIIKTRKIREDKLNVISRYTAIIETRDMAEHLARIDNVLMSNSLMVASMSDGRALTTITDLPPIANYVPIQQVQSALKELGEAIYEFYGYFDEFYEEEKS